ncbi:MAG: thiol oxidoreductase [Acidobacteria bacterium]|nr:thiol oxidoreductase [Acidobacteriota bacterium]
MRCLAVLAASACFGQIGSEKAVPNHLADDEEFRLALPELLRRGRALFNANWTSEDGGGRPLSKGNGRGLSDSSRRLEGSRAFNRLSGPDANSCFGCHNAPHGHSGGGGDFVTNVFVLGQRFDFATFDHRDSTPTRSSRDEGGEALTLETFANSRATTGMFGAGYLEMLARQMTAELQAVRDGIGLGETKVLLAKGVGFGRLTRRKDGTWDTSGVEGLSRLSLLSATSQDPPSLIIRPWHQAGNVISLREFTNNALNQHHGIQSVERFGRDTDPDGDGVSNELTRADVTALTLYQAALPVPGRVIPRDATTEQAITAGEKLFDQIGCAHCHIPALPLTQRGWIFEEPGPYNPPTNLRQGDAPSLRFNLNSPQLPGPRLEPAGDTVFVPAYTDFKLHDITSGENDTNAEPLDMNFGTWSVNFGKGNRKFLTKRLWGCANEPPYFHHGLYTTLRQAVLAHAGEALMSRQKFQELPPVGRDNLIEFLKSLQVLPPGTQSTVVDESYSPRSLRPDGKQGRR